MDHPLLEELIAIKSLLISGKFSDLSVVSERLEASLSHERTLTKDDALRMKTLSQEIASLLLSAQRGIRSAAR